MTVYSLLFILLVHSSLVPAVSSLRCQCSTQDGAVTCYNGWCEVQNYLDKLAACAVVQHGARQHYACVRVKKDSEDSCKVDKKNGETLVRCWCRSGDYCNVDLTDRVEDGDLQMQGGAVLTAEELPTSTVLTAIKEKEELDDFQIEQNYDEQSVGVADFDSDENELEDPLGPPTNINNRQKVDSPLTPRLPFSPHQRTVTNRREHENSNDEKRRSEMDRRRLLPPPAATSNNDVTLPPWRREYPVVEERKRQLTVSQQPADHFANLPPPPFVRPAPPFAPRTTISTSSSTTTTTSTTTTSTTTSPRTTTTISTTQAPTTTTTRRWIAPVRTTPDPAIEASRRAAAARSYKLQKQKYRPFDLNEKKVTTSTQKTTTTEKPHDDDSDVPDELFLNFPDRSEQENEFKEIETTIFTPARTEETSTTTEQATTKVVKTTVAPVATTTIASDTDMKKAEFGAIAGMVGGGNGPPPKMTRQQIPKSKQDFYQEIVRSASISTFIYVVLLSFLLTLL